MISFQLFQTLFCISDLRPVGGFCSGTPVFSTNKTDRCDITEILLKVALNIVTLTQLMSFCNAIYYI